MAISICVLRFYSPNEEDSVGDQGLVVGYNMWQK